MDPVVPLPQLTRDLELLKLRLSDMGPDQVDPTETEAMAREISAIRLQLKRLRFEHDAMLEQVRDLP